MKEYVYYIPIIDKIIVWDFVRDLSIIIDIINMFYNINKEYDIIYLGEL